jgi:hypothetical protein
LGSRVLGKVSKFVKYNGFFTYGFSCAWFVLSEMNDFEFLEGSELSRLTIIFRSYFLERMLVNKSSFSFCDKQGSLAMDISFVVEEKDAGGAS